MATAGRSQSLEDEAEVRFFAGEDLDRIRDISHLKPAQISTPNWRDEFCELLLRWRQY